ncbi:MAG: pyridoxal-phosphate dependent enzyme [Candidatus Micrarchaeia archaeon]
MYKQKTNDIDWHSLKDIAIERSFEEKIWSKMPHIEDGKVVNKTRLADISSEVSEISKRLYNIEFNGKIFAKIEWELPSGSIKMRTASYIMHDAIEHGNVKSNMPVFEATSGNFGISMGYMKDIGLKPFVIVSRKVYDGVRKELEKNGVKIIYINNEICPAPGIKNTKSQAEIIAEDIIMQLDRNGLDKQKAIKSKKVLVEVLEQNNPMNLARLLAKIYNGFCPRQYENESNIKAYIILGKELDEQLNDLGENFGDYSVVCTFGTGGTSYGLSRYYTDKFGKKGIYVAFPLEGQDVAGIRTKSMSKDLNFYRPYIYAGELELDWNEAKKLQVEMAKKGYNIGESSALALYGAIMLSREGKDKLIVIMPDDSKKYLDNSISVSLEEAKGSKYEKIVWAIDSYKPTEEARKLVKELTGKELIVPNSQDEAISYASESTIYLCIAGISSENFIREKAKKGKSLSNGLKGLADIKNIDIESLIKENK